MADIGVAHSGSDGMAAAQSPGGKAPPVKVSCLSTLMHKLT